MTEAPKARDKDVRPKALEHRRNSQTKTAPNPTTITGRRKKKKRRRKDKSHSRGKKASLKTQESSGFIRTGPFAIAASEFAYYEPKSDRANGSV